MNELQQIIGLDQIQIQKEDIVAIAVSQREEELHRTLKNQKAEIKRFEKSAQEISKQIAKDHKAFEKKALFESGIEVIVSQMNSIGFKVSASATAAIPEEGRTVVEAQFEISDAGDRNAWSHQSAHQVKKTISYPKELLDLLSLQKDKEAGAQRVREEAVLTKKEIADLGSLERKTRAALAVRVLEGSEQGRELLKKLQTVSQTPLLESK